MGHCLEASRATVAPDARARSAQPFCFFKSSADGKMKGLFCVLMRPALPQRVVNQQLVIQGLVQTRRPGLSRHLRTENNI